MKYYFAFARADKQGIKIFGFWFVFCITLIDTESYLFVISLYTIS